MITRDIIKDHSDPNLQSLTDEQIEAVEALARDAEAKLMHDKTRDWYKALDKDIFEATGIEKGGTEKTYNYLKRAMGEMKSKAESAGEYTTQLEALKAEKAELEKKIGEGGSDAQKKALADLKDEIKALKSTHQQELDAKENALKEKEGELVRLVTEAQFATAMSEFTLKSDEIYDPKVKAAYIKTAKEELLSEYTMDKDENGNTVWRDKEGSIAFNPKNGNKPYTTAELLAPKLAPIIDAGRQMPGGGTNVKGPVPSGSHIIQAKTQVEFNEKASEILVKKGIDRTSPEFGKQLTEIRKAHNASALPES